MNFCTNCGAELGLGRFCTNCGTPVARMIVPPTPPPPPLFAPTAVAPAPTPMTPAPAPVTPAPAQVIGPHAPNRNKRRAESKANTVWIALLLLGMVAAGVTGFWLATRDTGTDGGSEPGSTSSTTPSSPTSETPSDSLSDSLSDSPSAEPGDPSDLAPHTKVDGPAPLRPSRDLAGKPVTYPASNMLDDDDETAYRLPGDATGTVITFELPQASTLTAVGLINGYAKTDTVGGSSVDWYSLNRRILQVEWRFDDGSTVVQDLESSRLLQTMEIDPVETQTIELRLLDVSAPGRGARSKNVTAISDILLLGS